MAPKTNADASTIDATSYDWAKNCAYCHPGGGPAEVDRDGIRYDERDPATVAAFDGDYHGADWAASGVLEADCLLCHMESYRTSDRTPQIQAGNFRVAAAAGARMGTPRDNRVVDYDPAFALAIGRPAARNCSQCHGGTATELFNAPGILKSDVAKRGMSFGDPQNPDVHSANLLCVDCHRSGSAAGAAPQDHQFQKGNVMVGSAVRNDLDFGNGFLDCAACHAAGTSAGTPVTPPAPAHAGLPSLHLDRIHCSVCHVPEVKLFAVNTFDFLEGGKVPFFIGGNPKAPYGGGFRPATMWWRKDASSSWKLYPFNFITAMFWNRGSEGRDAIFLKTAKAAFDELVAEGRIANDINDAANNIPEPNTGAEIAAFRDRLVQKGVAEPIVWVSPDAFQISHNVSPKAAALGSGGCADCHSPGSAFFDRQVRISNFDLADTTYVRMELERRLPDGTASTIEGFRQYVPNWELMGYTEARKSGLQNLFPPAAAR